MRLLIAALAIALMMASAHAQSSQFPGSGIGKHAAKADERSDKSDQQKPKADDKAYNAALHNLPNKQYDPWHGVR